MHDVIKHSDHKSPRDYENRPRGRSLSIKPECGRRRDYKRSAWQKRKYEGHESERHRARNSGDSEADRRDDALQQCSSEHTVNDCTNRRCCEFEQTIPSLTCYPMKRGFELTRSGVPVAIEKERDQQAQTNLKDACRKCVPAPYDNCLRSRQQSRQFLQSDRTALVQVVPVGGETAAHQRDARDPVGRTRRTLTDEFLTGCDQTRYVVGQRCSQDYHRHDYDRG